MTTSQARAIWELCRQGFPLDADEAAEHWDHGERYEPGADVRVPLDIERLIELCNWELQPEIN